MSNRLTLTTWNVNSVRLRVELLKMLTEAPLHDGEMNRGPDVLCLQETKAMDDVFPRDAVLALGYSHLLIKGMKGYNGVAIASRFPLTPIDAPDWCAKGDCRHLAARIDTPGQSIELHNFYVPAGGPVPDRTKNPKFAHKLDFVTAMREWFTTARKQSDRIVLCGDLNIAPGEHDVWSHSICRRSSRIHRSKLNTCKPCNLVSTGPMPCAISFRQIKSFLVGGLIVPRIGA